MNASDDSSKPTAIVKAAGAIAEEKAQWVKRFLESGLSLREFSEQNGLGYMSLWRWSHNVCKPAVSSADSAAPTFAEIRLAPALEPGWVAEWKLPSGAVLRLSKDVPPTMLEVLLRVC